VTAEGAYDLAKGRLSDRRWRLNNLYWIKDAHGRRVKFRMNWAQRALFDDLHSLNLVLKARQLGMTSFIQLLILDACLFNANVTAGTVAHTLHDAEAIFKEKVRYPYQQLPAALRRALPANWLSPTGRACGSGPACDPARFSICTSRSTARSARAIRTRPPRSGPGP
jgi:hypothetical protein